MTNLSTYYASICKEPFIDREEEYDLFLQFQDTTLPEKERQAIKDRIIRANLRFVFKTAKNHSKNDPELLAELIAAGNEGLLVGFEKYNPTNKVRFLSYAGWWVLQRILKEMSKMRIVALPIWKQQLAARIQKANENRETELTFEQLKEEFPEESVKDLKELYQTKYLTYYLDDVKDDPSLEIDPIGTEVEFRIDGERVSTAVAKLPSPHKEIITMSFGLEDGEEQKLATISKQLGITKDQLREYQKEAMEMLKENLNMYFNSGE